MLSWCWALALTAEGQHSENAASETAAEDRIHLMFILTNTDRHHHLAERFNTYAKSLLATSQADLTVHAIVDAGSTELVRRWFPATLEPRVQLVLYDRDEVTKQIIEFVTEMRQHFSSGKKSYYHDAIFFVGPVVYRVLPETVRKVIITDTDLKFMSDIKELWSLFDQFSPSQVIGLAHDAQPVYHHIFSGYRSRNPGTRVGAPPPDGLPGFNSGVMLQNLDKMRTTDGYRSILNPTRVSDLAETYSFKGHLGDQDLYSLLVVEHEDLFYTLPCNWNRQLCRWWEKVYPENFDEFFHCSGPVKIYHGNCNTPIPDDTTATKEEL